MIHVFGRKQDLGERGASRGEKHLQQTDFHMSIIKYRNHGFQVAIAERQLEFTCSINTTERDD